MIQNAFREMPETLIEYRKAKEIRIEKELPVENDWRRLVTYRAIFNRICRMCLANITQIGFWHQERKRSSNE